MKKNTINWIILGALGLFLIFGHNAAVNIICKVVAIGLLLAAAYGVFAWWKTKSKAPDGLARLAGSLAFCALGLWILFKTDSFVKFINVVIGLAIIIAGAFSLYHAWKSGGSKVSLILPALAIALGIIIACWNAATTWFVVGEGFGLLYTAITGFLGERKKS